MAPQIYPVTLLDSSQVIQYVYDEGTQSLRTTATATIVGGDLTVDIDGVYSFLENPNPDNIGLIGSTRMITPDAGDQINRITSVTNDIVHALDVSLHNSDGSSIDFDTPLAVNTNSTASLPTIYNVSALVAGTEYFQALPIGTKHFTAKIRGLAKLQYSFNPGTTGSNFMSVPLGGVLDQEGLNTTSSVIFYFQTNKASQILEIEVWT